MSLFSKACSLCGANIFALGGNALKDGCYCKNCKSKLSPFFTHKKSLTVNDISSQLTQREINEQLFAQFVATKAIGNQPQVLIDENNNQFLVSSKQKKVSPTPDVMHFSQLIDCSIDIKEEKEEVKYKDFNDKLKSFSPPYYAYSYDFFINISVNIPYIQTIRIKLNKEPIDNDQPHVIEKTGGLGQMFRDALGSARSFNGMTSNIAEVQASHAYIRHEQIANEIRDTLLAARISLQKNVAAPRCPWCGCLVINNPTGICEHCCGAL